ncbi:MAG: type IX secretion system sortase PorU [Crocinitomicaceae bacterium]
MANFLKFFLFCFAQIVTVNSFAQKEIVEIQVNWDSELGTCDACDFNAQTKQIDGQKVSKLNVRNGSDFSFNIIDIVYENTIYQAVLNSAVISSSPNINIQIKTARNNKFLVSTFNPLLSVNGTVKKIKKIVVEINYSTVTTKDDREHIYANESVLRKGNWFKIGIQKSGVHKITFSDLNALGISTSGLNPKHINLYSNHNTELPISNSESRPDDLLRNSIYISGESDNQFNEADYILFYATGPLHESLQVGEGFNVSKNDFDSLSYAYICIDASVSPKRITKLSFPNGNINTNSNSFNEVVLHEEDLVNLLKSGGNWYGENFDIYQEQDFSITTRNAVTSSPAKMRAGAAIYSPSGNSVLSFSSNGQLINSLSGDNTSGSYEVAIYNTASGTFNINSDVSTVNFNFSQGGNPSSQAWLDVFQINYRRWITNSNEQIRVRDWNSVGAGNYTQFAISSATSGVKVWDVTNPSETFELTTQSSGNDKIFKSTTDSLHTFAVFNDAQAYKPVLIGSIKNQNLHALSQVDYLIVTPQKLKTQADRLADLHRGNGLSVHVVELQKIYNEFSCGLADPGAIKWFTKMFYDRANGDPNNAIKSLLLFGDGSYDRLTRVSDNELTNLIPTYQNSHGFSNGHYINFIGSYTSDDFFGLLDDDEGMGSSDLLDVGVGRLPIHTESEATAAIDKIEHYMNYGSTLYANSVGVTCDGNGFASSMGDWRTRNLLIADDEDDGKFVADCEAVSDIIQEKHPEINIVKLYLDAFQQEATSSGQRYPEVENAINQIINTGTLVANYVGHGGETGLSAERILSVPTIKTWTNVNNMPLFISATCEFSRFDDPSRVSAGEFMFLQPYGGAIALLTTTRLVFIHTNSNLVKNLYRQIFREENGKPLTFGEIIRLSKNLTAGDENMRNFTLLGDPALELGKPQPNIKTTKINSVAIASFTDTIKALSKVTIEGEITDNSGNLLSNFNGFATPIVYDKIIEKQTLGQDVKSPVIKFDDRTSQLYKGKSTVKDGKFKFTFIVPKDINYTFGNGKLSYYAENGTSQKLGFDTSIVIGGIDPNGLVDNLGPSIDLFMNDESFVNSGITDENPIFLAHVSDENGINTTGNGIGHDISLILDDETSNPIILNNFYESDLDTYQSGKARYQILDLEPGIHTARFKVWDVNNNSSEKVISFEVKPKEDVAIRQLLNYPNPFTTKTLFYFEHNQVCNQLETKVEIFTVSGKLVRTIFENVNTSGFRSDGISWDGRDDYGDKIGRGVYVYRLSIVTDDGQQAEKLEKLVIL